MIVFFQKMKDRWGIKSNWHFLLVNLIFAITGSMTEKIIRILIMTNVIYKIAYLEYFATFIFNNLNYSI